MRRAVVCFAFAVGACEPVGGKTAGRCEDGWSVEIVHHFMGASRVCRSPDGSEKDVVDVDRAGNVVGHQHFVGGKLDGRVWRVFGGPEAGKRVEGNYRHGVLDGEYRVWGTDGALIEYCTYQNGHKEGVCFEPDSQVQFDHGRRAGFWRVDEIDETRIYGGGGVLLAMNGRAMPLPPESITIDGEVVHRDHCPPANTPQGYGCAELFERYQQCALRSVGEREECRAGAREVYERLRDAP